MREFAEQNSRMTKEAESNLTVLKDRVADGKYVVEPIQVADAILRRLQLVLIPSQGLCGGFKPHTS